MSQQYISLDSKIYVAGHRGLVGSAIVSALRSAGYRNLVLKTHAELDLTRQSDVERFFAAENPQYVFLAAAKVGGIQANNTYPGDFISVNLSIQNNVIESARKAGVDRLLFLGSSCIYPRDCPQPIQESYLMTGALEPTNRPYAIAKIAGIESCWAANRQYGTRFFAVMPTNLYGPGDNYDLANSHVLPALIRKVYMAKLAQDPSIVVWGTGRPRREFLFNADLADACLFLMNRPDEALNPLFLGDKAPIVNVGCGEDHAISELAEMVMDVVGYQGTIHYDHSKPDGTPRKLLDVSTMSALGWRYQTPLKQGIALAYQAFLESAYAKDCVSNH